MPIQLSVSTCDFGLGRGKGPFAGEGRSFSGACKLGQCIYSVKHRYSMAGGAAAALTDSSPGVLKARKLIAVLQPFRDAHQRIAEREVGC